MAELVVTLTGDEANLFRAQQKILKQEMEMAEGYVKAGKAGKKSADDIADAHVKAFQKTQEAAKKVDEAYIKQVNSLKLQNVELTKGRAAAIEMKALQDGMTAAQARRLGDLQRENEAQATNKANLVEMSDTTGALAGRALAWASGVGAVATALGTADMLMASIVERQERALDLQLKLAPGQQDASINLAQVDTPELKKIFGEKIPQLQQRAGFPDQKALIDGLGAAYSQSGEVDSALNAVETAAKMTRQTPAALPGIAAGLAGLSTVTGTKEGEQNAALLLSTGKASSVVSQAGTAKNLGPVIAAARGAIPEQDTKQAAIESSALFAVFSGLLQDFQGDVSKNATNKFNRVADEFFDGLAKKTEELNSKINEMKVRDEVTPLERARIDLAEIEVQEKSKNALRMRGRGPDEAKATIELSEAIARRDEMRVKSTLTDDERKQFQELKRTQAELLTIRDPGTIKGRIETLQGNESARNLVKQGLGNDEASAAYAAMLDGTSAAAAKYTQATSEITFDPQVFRDQAKKQETVTPELANATSLAKIAAGVELVTQADRDSADRAAILEAETKAMTGTAVDALTIMSNKFHYSALPPMGGWNPLSTPMRSAASAFDRTSDFADGAIMNLTQRRDYILETQKPGDLRESQLELIATAITELKNIAVRNAQDQAQQNDKDQQPAILNELKKNNVLLEEQNRIQRGNGGAPSRANAIRGQIAKPVVLGAN